MRSEDQEVKKKPPPYVVLDKYEARNQSEGDRLVIKRLQEEGADLSQKREVHHYLYLPSEDAAYQASRELRAEGYEVEQRRIPDVNPSPTNPWLVLATIEAVVDNHQTERATLRFTELASRHAGEYDGWEAAAEP